MKKVLFVFVILAALVSVGVVFLRASGGRAQTSQEYETSPARRGELLVAVNADGVVRAEQSTTLVWKTSGSVELVSVREGDAVTTGQELASLAQTSLPQAVILARADLVQAQRTLDGVLRSSVPISAARQALESAEQLLEDARDPQLAQANAQSALRRAQKTVENAQRDLEIVLSPASAQSIESAYGVVLMWENTLKRTRQDIERVQQKLKKKDETYGPGESRDRYEAMLTNLTEKLVRYQRQAEDAFWRYQKLLRPPDANDVAVAQANLALAVAQLNQAEMDWNRVKDGNSPAELRLLQARVEDARSEVERLSDGTDTEELVAARARVGATRAMLETARQTAPFDGVITQVYNLPGDQVEPGSPAFRVDDLSRLLVEMRISEIDINRIRNGEQVSLSFDSVPGRTFRGRVVDVSPVANVQGGVATFKVVAQVVDPEESLRPGMTVTAEVVVLQLEDVLLVPAGAVRILEGQRVVYILRNSTPVPVYVTLGSSSGGDVQVVSGEVQPGDAVVMNP